MGSLDVESLFINIPLKETINICTNLLYTNVDVIEGINKCEFENLLPWLPSNRILCLTILFTNKRGVWPWDCPYRKSTFSGMYTHFYSFLPTTHEVGLPTIHEVGMI